MKRISREILLSLRGRRSARAFSEKLGYRSNQISRWESGHSRFSWFDFCDLCRRLDFSVEAALATYEFHDDHQAIEKIFSFLMPNATKKEIAKACEVSPLTLQRWYRGEFSPNADCIFMLFLRSGTPLAPLLNTLIVRKKMTSRLVAFLEREGDAISVMMEAPWTIAIACRCLLSDLQGLDFEKSLQHLSKQLRLSYRALSETVGHLMRARLLGFSEEKRCFYLPEGPAHYEFRNSYLSFVEGLKFWMRYSTLVLNNKRSPALGENHGSYLVFNLQSSQIKNVHEKIIALYKEIAAMSQENEKSNQCDRTFSFCMNLTRIDGPLFGELVDEKV